MTSDETSTLGAAEIAALRTIISRQSVVGTARAMRVSRHTLERGLAGLGIRHGSAAMIRLALLAAGHATEARP